MMFYGIVLIGCKAGHHRAPTVAAEFSDPALHIIHKLLAPGVTCEDLLMVINHCRLTFSHPSITHGISSYTGERLYIGWDCCYFLLSNGVPIPAMQFGQRLIHYRIEGNDPALAGTAVVRFHGSDIDRRIVLTYVLPYSICSLHPAFVSNDIRCCDPTWNGWYCTICQRQN